MTKPVFLVHSGDKGQWVWPFWYHYYQKYWRGYAVADTVFLSEEIPVEFPGVRSMLTGPGLPWGMGLCRALAGMDAQTVIYAHEDYFLEADTDPDTLRYLVDVLEHNDDIVLIKACGAWCGYHDIKRPLVPAPPSDCLRYDPTKMHDETLWTYDPDRPYVVSHQISIWDKGFLAATIKPQWSPWDHEMQRTPRASQWLKANNRHVYGYRRYALIPYCETVVRDAPRGDQKRWFKRVLKEAGMSSFERYCEMARIDPMVSLHRAGL